MAQFAAPRKFTQDHTIFLVGQDDRGIWCVQENHGLVEGAFVSRDDAVRYAQDESSQFPGSIVMVTPRRLTMGFQRAA